jgi:hypothetical protein
LGHRHRRAHGADGDRPGEWDDRAGAGPDDAGIDTTRGGLRAATNYRDDDLGSRFGRALRLTVFDNRCELGDAAAGKRQAHRSPPGQRDRSDRDRHHAAGEQPSGRH